MFLTHFAQFTIVTKEVHQELTLVSHFDFNFFFNDFITIDNIFYFETFIIVIYI